MTFDPMNFFGGLVIGAAGVGGWWWWIGHRAKVRALAALAGQALKKGTGS